jgi:hypothetical protein
MAMRAWVGVLLAVGGLSACSGATNDNPVDPTSDAGNGDDAGIIADAGDSQDAGNTAGAMNGCADADYVDKSSGSASSRMIMITSGGKFDFPCMSISAGQGVEFMWSFSTRPLEPGLAPSHADDPPGTTPSPILSHNSGSLYTVTFPNPGRYPYYVQGQDSTLLGVINVK